MEMKNNHITFHWFFIKQVALNFAMVKSAKKFRTLPADNTLHVKQYNKCTTLKFTDVFYSKQLITCY